MVLSNKIVLGLLCLCVLGIASAIDFLDWKRNEEVFGPRFHGPQQWTEELPKFFTRYPYKVIASSIGHAHRLVLTENGKVFAWGNGVDGQLGDNYLSNSRDLPVEVEFNQGVVIHHISAGTDYSLAVDSDGNVWGWGWGFDGQIGCEEAKIQPKPCQVVIPKDVRIVTASAGAAHSLAVDDQGNLYSWGVGESGQLGMGQSDTKKAVTTPQLVEFGEHVVDVCAGGSHSVVLTKNGDVYTTGWNMFGQLGLGATSDRQTFERIKTDQTWISIWCGPSFSLAMNVKFDIYGWGDGAYLAMSGMQDINREFTSPTKFDLFVPKINRDLPVDVVDEMKEKKAEDTQAAEDLPSIPEKTEL